jgi:hypothetical protein
MRSFIILTCLFSLFLVGCGTSVKKSSKKVVTSRPKTIREKLREEAIRRYRRMRFTDAQKRWGKARANKRQTRKPIAKYRRKRLPRRVKKSETIVRRLPNKRATPRPRTKVLANPDELKIEIDQNLAYFCMANRKRYQSPSACQQMTQNALESCEVKFEWDDRGLLKCVKSRLRF